MLALLSRTGWVALSHNSTHVYAATRTKHAICITRRWVVKHYFISKCTGFWYTGKFPNQASVHYLQGTATRCSRPRLAAPWRLFEHFPAEPWGYKSFGDWATQWSESGLYYLWPSLIANQGICLDLWVLLYPRNYYLPPFATLLCVAQPVWTLLTVRIPHVGQVLPRVYLPLVVAAVYSPLPNSFWMLNISASLWKMWLKQCTYIESDEEASPPIDATMRVPSNSQNEPNVSFVLIPHYEDSINELASKSSHQITDPKSSE